MADILKDYPTDSGVQGNRAECGGVLPKDKKELPYDPPKGPKYQMNQGAGLRGGTNHGCCGTQRRY